MKTKKRHPDYRLKDQAAGRCPYCLASADMDCDCEKMKAEPTNEFGKAKAFPLTSSTEEDEIAPKGCIDVEILKVLGKDKLEALMWYVNEDLKEDFVSCLNHSLKHLIQQFPSPPDADEETAIAEFCNEYAKLRGFKDFDELKDHLSKTMGTDAFQNFQKGLEQAARNLITRTEQKTASAIFKDLEKQIDDGWGIDLDILKKKHLSETEDKEAVK